MSFEKGKGSEGSEQGDTLLLLHFGEHFLKPSIPDHYWRFTYLINTTI